MDQAGFGICCKALGAARTEKLLPPPQAKTVVARPLMCLEEERETFRRTRKAHTLEAQAKIEASKDEALQRHTENTANWKVL